MTANEGGEFHPLALTSDVAPGKNKAFQLDGHDILVCNINGEFYAVRNMCSHAEEKLEGGRIRGHCVVCPKHGARFDLKDGRHLTPPAWTGIATYPLRVVDDRIEVQLNPRDPPSPKRVASIGV
ncbi:MAG: non-heme iron oxygenase ferredoxin subunit [Gammaproteobacteria bacterium]|nr:non-heme iron oxygenase ferredoxin subunit [Gammaproteobacteria bacterium]